MPGNAVLSLGSIKAGMWHTKASCSSLAILGQSSDREVWKGSHPVKTHILSSDVADTAPHGSKYENISKHLILTYLIS